MLEPIQNLRSYLHISILRYSFFIFTNSLSYPNVPQIIANKEWLK